jgi:hypothetical protein
MTMLKARWQGYEIDSSESAYGLDVPEQIQAGTYLRALLGSGYFVRSCTLLNEEPILRLQAFVQAHEEPEADICKALDKLVDKMQRSRGDVNVGVRAIESIVNYVEANRPALLAENLFYTSGLPDEAGKEADEEDEYEEESYYGEPPRRNVVLYLRSALVSYQKLSPEEQIEALEAGQAGWDELLSFGGLDDWGYSVEEDYSPSQELILDVRLSSRGEITCSIHWFSDGYVDDGYYESLLFWAEDKAGVKLGLYNG